MSHIIMNTLIYLPQSPNFEELIQNGHIKDIVVHGIDILCFLSNEKDFQSFFVPNGVNLYLKVVLPYLKITN